MSLRILRICWITPVLYNANEKAKRRLVRTLGLHFVPFGAPMHSDHAPISDDGLVRIILVSKFIKRKRILEFVQAINLVPPQYRYRIAVTIIGSAIGESREAYLQEVRDEVKRNSLTGIINLIPNVDHTLALETMAKSDVLVLFSTDEPASVSQVEAMSLGLAVLCAKNNGTAHYVSHDTSGLLIDESPESLSRAIQYLVKNPMRLEFYKKNALYISKKRYTPRTASYRLLRALST